LPKHKIDGLDIWPLLAGDPQAKNPHEAYFFYYARNELQAVRSGPWKLVLPHTYNTLNGRPGGRDGIPAKYEQAKVKAPELYDMRPDFEEKRDVAAQHPDIVQRLESLAEQCRDDLGDALTKRTGKAVREPGREASGSQTRFVEDEYVAGRD
jgi:arylsulfatase